MTSLRKGFITAGAIHGALLTLWLGYELTGKIYRENLRLDFTLSTSASAGGKTTPASEPSAATDTEGLDAPATPAAPPPACRRRTPPSPPTFRRISISRVPVSRWT